MRGELDVFALNEFAEASETREMAQETRSRILFNMNQIGPKYTISGKAPIKTLLFHHPPGVNDFLSRE